MSLKHDTMESYRGQPIYVMLIRYGYVGHLVDFDDEILILDERSHAVEYGGSGGNEVVQESTPIASRITLFVNNVEAIAQPRWAVSPKSPWNKG